MDFVAATAASFRESAESGLAGLFSPGGTITDNGIPSSLVEPLRYSLLGGGKRLRPVLCLAVCEALCGDRSPAMPAALAIEALHTYTLVHDDLPCMDDDAMRRGRPSVHAKFGYAQAVLVGDALQAVAFRLALAAPKGCAEALALAAGPSGVIGGQWLDVTETPPYGKKLVDYVHIHKTADIISCACEMGALSARAHTSIVESTREFGKALGVAFQIVDDLLDASDPKKNGELSILRIMPRAEAIASATQHTTSALSELDRMERMASRLSSNGAKTEAFELLRSIAQSQLSRTT